MSDIVRKFTVCDGITGNEVARAAMSARKTGDSVALLFSQMMYISYYRNGNCEL